MFRRVFEHFPLYITLSNNSHIILRWSKWSGYGRAEIVDSTGSVVGVIYRIWSLLIEIYS